MSMDALTAAAFSALAKRDLPALHAKLVGLAKTPPHKRPRDVELVGLIEAAMASLRTLAAWAQGETSTGVAQTKHGVATSDEAVSNSAANESPGLDIDPETRREFIANSEEMLQLIDDGILKLEKKNYDKATVESIFRAAHNLKGAAGMLGLKSIERLTHSMESEFDRLRRGELVLERPVIDQLFLNLDLLKAQIKGLKSEPSEAAAASTTNDLTKTEIAATNDQGGSSEQSSIRVDLQRLDKLVNLVGELVIDRTRFTALEDEIRASGLKPRFGGKMSETVQTFGRHMTEIHDIVMKIRMVPIGNAFTKLPRVVRDLGRQLNKDIQLTIGGADTELDKTIVEMIADPILHVVRNACDHGIEQVPDRLSAGKSASGQISINARQEGNQIVIAISDDGRGLAVDAIRRKALERGLISSETALSPRDTFNLIFEPGFSTAAQVTELSGRGVGMDVVRKQVAKLKGVIDLESEHGKGTSIIIRLPLTLSIMQSLLVESLGQTFAVPLSSVIESTRISPSDIQIVGDQEVIKRHDRVLPLLHLHKAMSLDMRDDIAWYASPSSEHDTRLNALRLARRKDRLYVVIVGTGERRFGIVCDQLLNQQEMVIKSLGPILKSLPCVAGGAVLGHGEVVLALDIPELEAKFRRPLRRLAA